MFVFDRIQLYRQQNEPDSLVSISIFFIKIIYGNHLDNFSEKGRS